MNLLNEGYGEKATFFKKAKGSLVFSKNKKFIDLSCGAGTMLLGHNSKIYKTSLKKYLNSGVKKKLNKYQKYLLAIRSIDHKQKEDSVGVGKYYKDDFNITK